MRERMGLEGFWQGRLELNPEIDVESPAVIEQPFHVPTPWNLQIRHWRRLANDLELSGIVKPLQNQNFRDIQRRFSEGTITLSRTVSILPERIQAIADGKLRAFLVFEGSNYRTDVTWNGAPAGDHEGGHLPFEFEISRLLTAGENRVTVKVDNLRRKHACPQEQFNWMNYGGPYRPVYIEWRTPVFIRNVQIQPGRDASGWFADITATLSDPVAATLSLELESGNHTSRSLLAVQSGTGSTRLRVDTPCLWEPGRGGTSSLRVRFDPDQGDACCKSFGFRTVEISGPEIRVNGKRVFLKGASFHEQHSTFGNSVPAWVSDSDVRLMQYAGLNAVRTSHYPHADSFYEACDRHGLMVISEMPCWQFNQWHFERESMRTFCIAYAREMVDHLGHHPAIIGWGVHNESHTFEPGAVEFFGAIAHSFKTSDPTRFTASAESTRPPQHLAVAASDKIMTSLPPTAAVVDVVGVNNYAGWYSHKATGMAEMLDSIHQENPDRPLMVTEFGAEGIPGCRSWTLEPWTEDYQAALVGRHLKTILARPWLSGFFIWLFADYECSSIGIIGINSKGLVDGDRRPKPVFETVRRLLNPEAYHD